MIYIGLGSNLPSPRYGPPRATLEAALKALAADGLHIAARSRWYRSAPVPPSGQPWYVNGVVRVETALSPARLLALLLGVERRFGRARGANRNAARVLDLDLLDYNGEASPPGAEPELPHPRMGSRAFVLLPLAELVPGWRHPVTGTGIADLIAALPPEQKTEPLPDD